MAESWKNFQKEFNVFGFNFTGYIILITIASALVTAGTIFLIYSVDDPRKIWKDQGWKAAINSSTMLIVIIGGANGIMLGSTKTTIDNVLQYYKPTTYTKLFYLVYWISTLTPLIFFCIYYPYIVCNLLFLAFSISVTIGILCSCGLCCTICCLYFIFDRFFEMLLYPLICCLKDEKRKFIKDAIVFTVFTILLTYGMIVGVIVIIFAITGGVENTDFCIRDNVKSWLALLYLQSGPIIAAIGFMYKCCKCIKSAQGTMELKEEVAYEIDVEK